MWHMTFDMRDAICSTQGWWLLSQNFKSLALMVWEWMWFEDLAEKDQLHYTQCLKSLFNMDNHLQLLSYIYVKSISRKVWNCISLELMNFAKSVSLFFRYFWCDSTLYKYIYTVAFNWFFLSVNDNNSIRKNFGNQDIFMRYFVRMVLWFLWKWSPSPSLVEERDQDYNDILENMAKIMLSWSNSHLNSPDLATS